MSNMNQNYNPNANYDPSPKIKMYNDENNNNFNNNNSNNFNLIEQSVKFHPKESENPYSNDFNNNIPFDSSPFNESKGSHNSKTYNNSINQQLTPGGFNDISATTLIENNQQLNISQYDSEGMGFPQVKSKIIHKYPEGNSNEVDDLFPRSNKSNMDDFPKSKGDI